MFKQILFLATIALSGFAAFLIVDLGFAPKTEILKVFVVILLTGLVVIGIGRFLMRGYND